MKKQFYLIISLIIFLLVAFISILNVRSVPLNFGFTVVEWPLILIIIGTLIIGVFIASLLAGVRIFQYENKVKQLKQELQSSKEKGTSEVEKAEYNYQNKIDSLNRQIDEKDAEISRLKREISNRKV